MRDEKLTPYESLYTEEETQHLKEMAFSEFGNIADAINHLSEIYGADDVSEKLSQWIGLSEIKQLYSEYGLGG